MIDFKIESNFQLFDLVKCCAVKLSNGKMPPKRIKYNDTHSNGATLLSSVHRLTIQWVCLVQGEDGVC